MRGRYILPSVFFGLTGSVILAWAFALWGVIAASGTHQDDADIARVWSIIGVVIAALFTVGVLTGMVK